MYPTACLKKNEDDADDADDDNDNDDDDDDDGTDDDDADGDIRRSEMRMIVYNDRTKIQLSTLTHTETS